MNKTYKRYLQLDGLRGLFLIVMVLDHFEGPFRKIIYEKFGFFTGAEGFVFLSGIVAGYVYSKYNNEKALFQKSFTRLFKIYKYQIISIIVLFSLMHLVPFYSNYWNANIGAFNKHPLKALFSSLTLMYQPNPVDILPLYIFLVLLMPFMMLLLKGRKIGPFFIVSVLLWLLAQFQGWVKLIDFSNFGLDIDFGFFNYFAWQILFFIGIYLGYKRRYTTKEIIPLKSSYIMIASFICLAFFVVKMSIILGSDSLHIKQNLQLYRLLFSKSTLGVARIINFLALSYLVAGLMVAKKNLFKSKALVILGQNSIQVFTVHVISYILFFPMYAKIAKFGILFQLIFSLFMVTLLYVYVVLKQRLKPIRKKKGH